MKTGITHLPAEVQKYDRVTEILNKAGLVDFSQVPPDVLRRAQEFGTAAHSACEFMELKTIDWTTVDEPIRKITNAWDEFLALYSLKLIQCEMPVWSTKWKYRGTLDRVYSTPTKTLLLIDIKTSSQMYDATRLQTAAYKLAYEEMTNQRIAKRWAVQLYINKMEIGFFKVYEYKNHKKDENEFIAHLLKTREAN